MRYPEPMSKVTDELGLTGPTAEAVKEAWAAWGETLGLYDDALEVFTDLMLERSTKVDGALPPGFALGVDNKGRPNVFGSPTYAAIGQPPLDPFSSEVYPYIMRLQDDIGQEDEYAYLPQWIVKNDPYGRWIAVWRWVDQDDIGDYLD